MVLGDLDRYMQKHEIQLATHTIHTQKNLKMDKRWKKVPEENIGRKISDIPCSNMFIDMSPRARDIKEEINKWDLIKIKSFCIAKENMSKMKKEPTVWENIFASDTSNKGLISQNIERTHMTPPQEDKQSN